MAGTKGILALFAVALAGMMLVSFPLVGGETTPEEDSYEELYIDHFAVRGDINHHYAVTELKQEFRNPGEEATEATFRVEIPERAFITNFSLEVDGITYYAEVLEKDHAREEYSNASAAGHNTAILEMQDATIFTYSVTVAADDTSTLTLRYEEFLEQRTGKYEYDLLLESVTGYYPVSDFSIVIDIKTGTELQSVEVPPEYPGMTVDQKDDTSYTVEYTDSGAEYFPDATLVYRCAPTGKNGIMLSQGDEDSGYFLHLFSPQGGELGEDALGKEIIFVLDTSGSMSGEKIEQLKDAFGEIIQDLADKDNFNIIEFNSDIDLYEPEVLLASDDNKDDAESYIRTLSAGGSTNINDAMLGSLELLDHETDYIRVVVLLTDGQPTAGETSTSGIRSNVLEANDRGTTIFTLGFGYDLDWEFIEAMALENGGTATRIQEGSDAAAQMTGFYDGISTPLLSNIEFDYGHKAYGLALPSQNYLFEGAELAVLGKYSGEDGVVTAKVTCNADSGTREYVADFDLGGDDNDFIPRLWAYRRIMSLLDSIKVEGEIDDLVDTIVDIAMENSFVTPYTSLFVDVPQGEGDTDDESPDTDGDGVSDEEEMRLASDPKDDTDAPPAPAQGSTTNGVDGGDGSDGGGGGTGGGGGGAPEPDSWDYRDYADGEDGYSGASSTGGRASLEAADSAAIGLFIVLPLAIIIPLVVVAAVLVASRKPRM